MWGHFTCDYNSACVAIVALKNDGWKTTFLLGRHIFRGYVRFPGYTSENGWLERMILLFGWFSSRAGLVLGMMFAFRDVWRGWENEPVIVSFFEVGRMQRYDVPVFEILITDNWIYCITAYYCALEASQISSSKAEPSETITIGDPL